MTTVLLVEDDKAIAEPLTRALGREGYEVLAHANGGDALKQVRESDIVILDLGLPDMDGLDVARTIRAQGITIPILILTARTGEVDMVVGLDSGADDYVTKPFSNRELVARVKANLRRQSAVAAKSSAEDDKNSEITVGDLTIHPEAYTVSKNGQRIELTHREFELLHYLAQHLGQVMTREHLLQTVWGYDYFGDVRTVDVTVRRLREKIEDNPSRPTWLVTRRGVGYYLRNPEVE